MPGYDESTFPWLNKPGVIGGGLNFSGQPRHLAFYLRMKNEKELNELWMKLAEAGIVIESLVPQY
jgi:hypothetical protein